MSIVLDLRSPTVVVVGRWNDAILNQPGWIAKYVMDVPEGEQIEVRTFVRPQDAGPPQQVFAYSDFALGCLGSRLELFQTSDSDDRPVYNVLTKLAEVLPHTPISAVGVRYTLPRWPSATIAISRAPMRRAFASP